MMMYRTHILANGIRLVHRQVPNMIAHLGVLMNTGSRDEGPDQHGMAHLIEHMFFKGTQRRKAYHIISRMEDAGGEINAYTTKEETALHTSFMLLDMERGIELLFDILAHSMFPDNELNKEKGVITDEINSYLDNPSELIFDDFEEQLFDNQAIGRNILGTAVSLAAITRPALLDFFADNYFTDEMVVSCVGNIDHRKLVRLAGKYFGQLPPKSRKKPRHPVHPACTFRKTHDKNTYQVHSIIGSPAYPVYDERRIPLHLLNNFLGGPGLNTRLNMTLREKNGLSYHAESHYHPYSDTGVFCVYFSTDKSKMNRSHSMVLNEFKKLKQRSMGDLQLHRAKKQLMGQITISAENHEHLMLTMAKSCFLFDRVDSLEEISAKIEKITAGQIMEIANEIFCEARISELIYV